MKYAELQQKTAADLQKMLADARAELQTLTFKVSNEQEKHVRKVRVLRKQVARILTALNSAK